MRKTIISILICILGFGFLAVTEASAFSRKRTPTTIKVVVRTPDGSAGAYGCPGTRIKVKVWSQGYRNNYIYPSGSHTINSLTTTSSVSFQYSTSMWRTMWKSNQRVVSVEIYNGNSLVPCDELEYSAKEINSGSSTNRFNILFVTLPSNCCYQG